MKTELKDRYQLEVATVELTLRCNMKCIHCGSSAGKGRKSELTTKDFSTLFDGLSKLGCSEVCLLGGEPFLHPDWFELANIISDMDMNVIFITNGLAVDDSMVKKLKQIKHLSRIAISLDGSSQYVHDKIRGRKGSFRAAINALDSFIEAGFETGVITTIMKHNLEELKKLRELLIKRNIAWQIQIAGTNGCRFNPDYLINEQEFYVVGELITETRKKYPLNKLTIAGSHDIGYFSKYFSDYGEHPQKYWRGCGAGIFTIGIMSDGSVKGCLALNDRFIEANIRERSIEDIWHDPGLFIRNRDFDVNRLHGFCAVCQYSEICRAGCQDMCFSSTGSVYSNKYCFHRLEEEYAVSPNKNIID